MTEFDAEDEITSPFGGDEATLAASSDVVATVRAQAAKLRAAGSPTSTAPADDAISVWVPDEQASDDEPETLRPGVVEAAEHDITQPDASSVPAASAATQRATPSPKAPGPPASDGTEISLIDGVAPPQPATTYWEPAIDKRSRPSVSGAGSGGRRRVPLWLWAILAIILIIAVSVALSVALTSVGATS